MATTAAESTMTPLPSFHKLTKFEYCIVADNGNDKQQEQPHCPLISFGDSASPDNKNKIRIHNHCTSTPTVVQLSENNEDQSLLRAIACSPDGRRVAVGYDYGSTRIYTFDKADVQDSLHPFLRQHKETAEDDNEEDDEDTKYFAGPRVSASIRDLAFDPRSSPVNGYLLAVASEDHSDGNGLFVVNVASSESVLESKYLVDESQAYGGVRSLSYSRPIKVGEDQTDEACFLAALGQDGFLTLYSCNGTDTPDVSWSEWYHSARPVGSGKDLGYAVASMSGDNAADDDNSNNNKQLLTIYDRAASLAWAPDGKSLCLAGGNDVELRCLGLDGSTDADDTSAFETPHYVMSNVSQQRGHSNAIVASAFDAADGNMLVTLAKDGRICAWDMDPKACANPTDNKSIGRFRCVVREPSSTDEHPVSVVFSNKAFHVTSSSGSLHSFSTSDIQKITKAKANAIKAKTAEAQPSTVAPTKNTVQSNKTTNPYAKASKPAAAAPVATKTATATDAADAKNEDSEEEVELMDFDVMSSNPVARPKKSKFVDTEAMDGGDFDDESHASYGYDDVDKDVAALKPKPDIAAAVAATAEDGAPTNTQNEKDGAFGDAFDGTFENDNNDFGDDYDDAHHNPDAPSHTAMVAQEPPQEAFAPSSTPVNVEHAHMRRILCWNHMGVITSRRDEMNDEQHMVDISLNDATLASANKNFMDAFGFDQGSLGEDGAMFATYNGTGDDQDGDANAMLSSTSMEGSKLFFFRFDTIGAQKRKDWTATLAAGEHALGVACGEGWAAVATSRRMLRLFTSGGIQRIMMCLKGDPVTIVGRGRLVAVFYHVSSPLTDKTQQLGYTLFDAMEGTALKEGHVTAIQKGQKLTWAGFSNDLSLVVMESSGLVSILSSAAGWQWVPVLDTLGKKKSSEDSFWPVSVLHGNFICVPLKGGHEHPDATRRPVTTSMELRLPLAQGMKKTMALEETLVRAGIALGQKKFTDSLMVKSGVSQEDLDEEYHHACAQVDKVTIKLFAAALGAESVERALDLVSLLHSEKSYEILMTVADQLGQHKVTEKIQLMMDIRFPPEQEQDFLEDEQGDQWSGDEGDNGGDYVKEELFTEPASQTTLASSHQRVSPNERLRSPSSSQGSSRKNKRSYESPAGGSFADDLESESPASPVIVKTRKLNPFAKKNKTSSITNNKNPFAKSVMQSPTKPISNKRRIAGATSPPRVQLSRQSTFSVKAKETQRSMKHFL